MTPPLLELENVVVKRELNTALAIDSLRIGADESVAILGPNGCGKSTLVKTISRECYPLALPGASVRVFGREIWHVFELRSKLGIISNDLASAYARDVSGRDAVLSGFFSSIGVWDQVSEEMTVRATDAMALMEVSHLADRPMCELSSGELRRLLIARALVHNPQALLLDEPSTSLDLHAQRALARSLSRLAQSGVTLVMVTHSLHDIVPEIGRVIFLRDGKVAEEGPKVSMLTAEKLSELFDCQVRVEQRDGYYNAW